MAHTGEKKALCCTKQLDGASWEAQENEHLFSRRTASDKRESFTVGDSKKNMIF